MAGSCTSRHRRSTSSSRGGLFHGFQLWVNLPKVDKLKPPAYQDLRSSEVGLITSADGGSLLRVIAGEVGGVAGPGSTHTPMAMVHATIAPGGELTLPWRPDFNALVYVMSGDGFVGPGQTPVGTGQLAVFGPGDASGCRRRRASRRGMPRVSTWSSSAAGRSGNPWPGPGRSS